MGFRDVTQMCEAVLDDLQRANRVTSDPLVVNGGAFMTHHAERRVPHQFLTQGKGTGVVTRAS